MQNGDSSVELGLPPRTHAHYDTFGLAYASAPGMGLLVQVEVAESLALGSKGGREASSSSGRRAGGSQPPQVTYGSAAAHNSAAPFYTYPKGREGEGERGRGRELPQ